MKTEDTNLEKVLDEEREALARRRQTQRAAGEPGLEGWEGPFGVALSGGGIRSATMSLGFLEVLNRAGLLRSADYLSTVSGGGYLGAYVQAALHERRNAKDPYGELFSKDVQAALMAGRRYLAPGAGVTARFRLMRFVAAILVSMLLNLLWMLALVVMVGAALGVVWSLIGEPAHLWSTLILVSLVVLAWHFSVHWLRPTLWSAAVLTTIEALLLGVATLLATKPIAAWSARFPGWVGTSVRTLIPVSSDSPPAEAIASWHLLLASALVFAVVGFFANPNLLTMHIYYKAGLARAYLGIVSKRSQHVRLGELASAGGWTVGPYPLINGCVNLLRDPTLAGARASDHFLFSPLFCGSRLTGYRRTAKGSYASLELATAVTASGAALNPSMGDETSPVLAFLLSLLSLRLGYWTHHRKASAWRPTFWPWPLLAEAFQRTGKDRDVLNVADGGFVENLGIYELLRRECRLIVALDAGCDARHEFGDLRNLVVRARQELGIEIEFLQKPEETIRPSPSGGFSPSHFVIARARGLPGSAAAAHGYQGVIVYAKSSLRAPASWKNFGGDKSIAYKTYHPAFPHESTADQFFDEAQWSAYFNLGRFIAGDVIGVDVRKDELWNAISVVDAFAMWSQLDDDAKLREHLNLRPANTPPGLASGVVQNTPNAGSAAAG